jgi:DNA-binding NtrC family response regulator
MATSRSHSACLACPPPAREEAPKPDSVAGKPGSPVSPVYDDGDAGEFELVGSGAAMTRLRLQVRRLGPHFRTVLVSGEAGTGKELTARALHRLSHGIGERFVVCDATAMSDGSGGKDGTAASARQLSRMVKVAQGGTLFFDGIGEMPMEAQVELLRILRLQERGQRGATTSGKIDLRIIASTREDLKVLTFAHRFRQELYQRLAMVEIALPPLRDRREDIPELAAWLLRRLPLLDGVRVEGIAEDAMERLLAYRWPGNVRELDGVLRHGVSRCGGVMIKADHLPALMESEERSSAAEGVGTARLQDVVEQHVLRVLKDCGGNKLRAAELLGISRSTLYRMLDTNGSNDAAMLRGGVAKEGRYTG